MRCRRACSSRSGSPEDFIGKQNRTSPLAPTPMRKRALWGDSLEETLKRDEGKTGSPKLLSSSEKKIRVGTDTFAAVVWRRAIGTGPGGCELGAWVSRTSGGSCFNFGSSNKYEGIC